MIKKILLFSSVLILTLSFKSNAQVIFWTEDFNNGCTSDCEAITYTGPHGAWTQTIFSAEGSDPNIWYISCAENGHTAGLCGTGCQPLSATATGASLHVGSNATSLGDIGAAYDAGGLCGLLTCPATNRRIESPTINCSGFSSISLDFVYIERGDAPNDDASIYYYDGSIWSLLINTPVSNNAGCFGQGRWTAYSISLPASADNNPNVKIGFLWINNDDGVGTDPSFAVDNINLSVNIALPPAAEFTTSSTSFCDSVCIDFTDSSTNSPTGWTWIFESGTPDTVYTQTPTNICYNTPGTYDVTLIATNASGSDTIIKSNYITVNACHLPVVNFNASDTNMCEKSCIDFFDLSTNSPTQWNWYFPGALPDTSTTQNPIGICYNNYGTFSVTLVATNVQGSDSATYSSYITINQNPPQPTISINGSVLTSTPATAYQWYFNNTLLPGETNQVLFNPQPGDYYVIITDSNGCNSASNQVTISGFVELMHNEWLSCYPNPVNDFLVVKFKKNISHDALITVTDVTGKVFKQSKESSAKNGNEIKFDLKKLVGGIYFITIAFDKEKFITKFVKQ
ncbi:MAG: PKD domain-containing protein [Bacteroidia bacterium]